MLQIFQLNLKNANVNILAEKQISFGYQLTIIDSRKTKKQPLAKLLLFLEIGSIIFLDQVQQ